MRGPCSVCGVVSTSSASEATRFKRPMPPSRLLALVHGAGAQHMSILRPHIVPAAVLVFQALVQAVLERGPAQQPYLVETHGLELAVLALQQHFAHVVLDKHLVAHAHAGLYDLVGSFSHGTPLSSIRTLQARQSGAWRLRRSGRGGSAGRFRRRSAGSRRSGRGTGAGGTRCLIQLHQGRLCAPHSEHVFAVTGWLAPQEGHSLVLGPAASAASISACGGL